MLARQVLGVFTRPQLWNPLTRRTVASTTSSSPELVDKLQVTLIPGDGVGVELAYSLQDVIKNTGIPLKFDEVFLSEVHYSRSASIDDVIASIKSNNHVALKGVIQEGLRYDSLTAGINTQLRRRLDLFASVVHIKTMQGLKTRHGQKLDFIVIREQTEGEYSSLEHESVPGVIECLKITTREKCERIAKYAFDFATKHKRKRVTCVHKANIMKLGDGLFLNVCTEMSKLYPKIEFNNMIIDNCCMQLVSNPQQFDVMVMPNLYGNIIDNLSAGLAGGAGVVPAESVGSDYVIFEPASRHSFKEGVGRQIANPIAMILACGRLLNHLHLNEYGNALTEAVEQTIKEKKVRTRDMGGYASTRDLAFRIVDNYQWNMTSDDEFEDAVESLDSLPNQARVVPTTFNERSGRTTSAFKTLDENPHRRRLSAVKSRMRTEFGLGSSNFGSQNSFDEVCRSDCTSIASWGRNFLSETSNGVQAIAVCPADTLSTRAQSPPDVPTEPPPLLPLERRNSRPLPPPLPKRPQLEKPILQPSTSTSIPSSIVESSIEKDIEKNNETVAKSVDYDSFGEKRGHAKTNSLDRGLTLAKTIKCGPFPPTSKSNSLNRGMSPSIVQNAVCEEEQRINNAHGVINQITLAILSSSGETDDDGPKSSTSSSSNISKSHKKFDLKQLRLSNTSINNDEVATSRGVPNTLNYSHSIRRELPAVGEESSTASSTPIKSHPSPSKSLHGCSTNVPLEVNKKVSTNSLENVSAVTEVNVQPNRASHKRYASNVDCKITSFKQVATTSFKECRSATDLDQQPTRSKVVEITSPLHKRMLSQTHSIDPITQDVERRMSMKDHHSTLGSSSKSDDVSRDQSLHSLHSSFDHARTMLRSYSSMAQVFFRGAYQKARNVVTSSSTPKCSSLVGKDDEALESDAASSTVSMSASENNMRSYNRIGDGYPVICRPKNSKRGPNDFGQLRVVQEINNEHSGAIWALKFSNCGRLLATAGNDNLVRVWVLRNYLNYFIRLRDKYNQQYGNESTNSQDFEHIQMHMEQKDAKNFAEDDDSSINSRKSPLDSSASTKSCSTQAQSAGVSQNTSSSRSSQYAAVFAPKPFCIYRGHTADVLDLAWSPKNYFLLSSGMDNTVKLWHLTRSECLCSFQHNDFVTCIAFMPNDDRNFISGSMDGKIRLWHIPEKRVLLWNEVDQHTNNNQFITAITFYRNKFVIVGTYDGRCFFYKPDLNYHTVINIRSTRGKNSRGHKISALTVYKDYLLVTSNDSRIRMYNLHNNILVCKFKGAQIERSQIKASFSPDGRHIISGSEDNYTYIWQVVDLSNALSLHYTDYERVRIHNTVVTAAQFAPKPQLFFDLLNENQSQLLPVYSSAYTKRKDLNAPISAPISTSPGPSLDAASEQSRSRSKSLFSGLSNRMLNIANDLRLSRRNLYSFRPNEQQAVYLTGDIIVTADQNGSIKLH